MDAESKAIRPKFCSAPQRGKGQEQMDSQSIRMAEKLLEVLNDVDLLRADSALKIASTVINERASLVAQTRYGQEFNQTVEAV